VVDLAINAGRCHTEGSLPSPVETASIIPARQVMVKSDGGVLAASHTGRANTIGLSEFIDDLADHVEIGT
jgi:hypothetical protein